MRLGVNALMVRDGKLLVVEIDDENGLHYNLPGGGVEEGELMHDALKRELREEASLNNVSIGRLVLVWEYIPTADRTIYGKTHKIHHVFEVQTSEEPSLPTVSDDNLTGLKWLPLAELATLPLIPNLDVIKNLLDHPTDTAFVQV